MKKQKLLERDIQQSVVSFARRQGITAHKFSSEARRNVPDYIFLFNGRTYFIEFKATGKKARDGQLREIGKLRVAGFPVDVADDIAFGKRLVLAFKHDQLV